MTAIEHDDGMCHETSGFLFSHKCDRFSVQKCGLCQKPVCEDHGHQTPEGIVCTVCLKKKAADERLAKTDTDTTHHSYHDHYSSDPYFYGPRYYPGYGVHSTVRRSETTTSSVDSDNTSGGDFPSDGASPDPADFTEGDAESVRQEEDADFETDMGAS